MPTHDAIRRYLAELETALRGADPALVHDALIDAQTHLAEAIINGASAEDAIRAFGEPGEIARAYLDAEAAAPVRKPVVRDLPPATPASPSVVLPESAAKPTFTFGSIFGIWGDRYAWGAYVLLTFGAVVSGLAGLWAHLVLGFSVSTAPIFIGIPCFVLLLASVRGISLFLGSMIEALLGVRMPHRVQPVDLTGAGGFFRRIGCWFTDGRSWLTLVFVLANMWVTLPLAIVLGVFSLIGAGLIVEGISGADLAYGTCHFDGLVTGINSAAGNLFAVIFGFLLLTALLWLSKGIAFGYAHLVKAIQIARSTAK